MGSFIRLVYVSIVAFLLLVDFLSAFSLTSFPSGTHTITTSNHLVRQRTATHDRRRFGRLHVASESVQESKSSTATQVLYQKIIRPTNQLPQLLFLGHLVEYLESHFQLPSNLPMVYESLPGNEETRCLLAWDSPLSPSPDATRMEIEVVGIYTDDRSTKNSTSSSTPAVPNMAMVVVRKSKQSTSTLPPMMKNLFQDSEKKILKSLDRGLEDVVAGRIKFENTDDKQKKATIPKNVQSVDEALQAELMDDIPKRRKPKVDAQDVVFDAYATADTDTRSEEKPAKPSPENIATATATMNARAKGSKNSVESSSAPTGDFAVEAAKRKAASAENVPLEDYAVAAARRVQQRKVNTGNAGTRAKPRADSPKQSTQIGGTSRKSGQSNKPDKQDVKQPEDNPQPSEGESEPMAWDSSFKIPDYMGVDRTFRTTISRPKDRVKTDKRGEVSSNATSLSPPGKSSSHKTSSKTGYPEVGEEAKEIEVTDTSVEKPSVHRNEKKTGESKSDQKTSDEEARTKSKPMPSREQIEKDIMKAAEDAMSEISEQGQDMTPEELLQDVLKFGEEKEKEDTAGSGFATAAFDKAKDLMRQQHEKRQAKMGDMLQYKEMDTSTAIKPPINNSDELTPEEELRRMFEAGEKVADGLITKTEEAKDELTTRGTTDEDIDALIAKDKTISKHARSLDEELTELELTINSSPGEEFDGPKQNPLFDIMSGPEVYNRNVELDTVNYPGAMPGKKAVNLPKELKEAIQQAEFAVETLSGLETIESEDENGTKTVKYTVGERELTQEQVSKLEIVAREAIDIGIIKNPVQLLDESSRLQMVVDELWDQPEERFREVAENYKDLLLSDNFVDLIKARMVKMSERDLDALRRDDESLKEPHERERKILGQLVAYAQLLLKETKALGAELEAQQLEVIRSICQVAMDPKHQTEDEAAMALSDAVRDMRPLLDDAFVAYLKYAVAEEEAKLARAGLVDDPEHNHWLFVLKIVQQGVYAEIAKGINRYIEHIWYVLRMETPKQRKMLLSELIDVMPTMDVRPFVQVVENIVGSLGDSAKGEFDGAVELGEMTNKLLQLRRDIKELLPPDRINEMSRDADEWAARQKNRLLEARTLGKQRLQAANDIADRQGEIDAIGRRGETERFD